jgi:hypothetical protein
MAGLKDELYRILHQDHVESEPNELGAAATVGKPLGVRPKIATALQS